MTDYIRRKLLSRINRFQLPMVLMTLTPTIIFCVFSTFFVVYLHDVLVDLVKYKSDIQGVYSVNQWAMFILLVIWLFFGVVYYWAYKASSNLVGPFERIIRELDEINEGSDRQYIKARDNDYLANELVKRVNVLIKKTKTSKSAGGSAGTIG